MPDFEGFGASVFGQFPQPESNDAGAVDAALQALRCARDEPTSKEAYDAFLWAVGNNHAGTYYPVILAVLPEIEQILVSGELGPNAQRWKHSLIWEAHSYPR